MSKQIFSYPTRRATVTAEVLCRLLEGEILTGMSAVRGCNTTRLAAVVHYLSENYAWTIDRVDVAVGTSDGRVPTIAAYYLPREVIRKAFDSGALAWCRSVKSARETVRKNAARAGNKSRYSKPDIFQGQLFGSGYEF